MTGSVVTLGETMALLTTPPAGRITHAAAVILDSARAEVCPRVIALSQG